MLSEFSWEQALLLVDRWTTYPGLVMLCLMPEFFGVITVWLVLSNPGHARGSYRRRGEVPSSVEHIRAGRQSRYADGMLSLCLHCQVCGSSVVMFDFWDHG